MHFSTNRLKTSSYDVTSWQYYVFVHSEHFLGHIKLSHTTDYSFALICHNINPKFYLSTLPPVVVLDNIQSVVYLMKGSRRRGGHGLLPSSFLLAGIWMWWLECKWPFWAMKWKPCINDGNTKEKKEWVVMSWNIILVLSSLLLDLLYMGNKYICIC